MDACSLTGLELGLSFSIVKDKSEKEKPLALKYDHLSLGSGVINLGQTSPGSSYSNSSTLKKERGASDEDEEEAGCPRKKLRLTKEQSAVLEDSFKQHTTLNPNQKEALARQLNLRPRQVEVWFQNRRARTKLKQTEMNLELLKKCCDSLTEENKRLHRELQELRALQLGSATSSSAAVFMTICPSCEKIKKGKTAICSSPFARSSAAC